MKHLINAFLFTTITHTATASDLEKEKRWADQVVDAMPDVFQGVARQAVAHISKTLSVRHA